MVDMYWLTRRMKFIILCVDFGAEFSQIDQHVICDMNLRTGSKGEGNC